MFLQAQQTEWATKNDKKPTCVVFTHTHAFELEREKLGIYE